MKNTPLGRSELHSQGPAVPAPEPMAGGTVTVQEVSSVRNEKKKIFRNKNKVRYARKWNSKEERAFMKLYRKKGGS